MIGSASLNEITIRAMLRSKRSDFRRVTEPALAKVCDAAKEEAYPLGARGFAGQGLLINED